MRRLTVLTLAFVLLLSACGSYDGDYFKDSTAVPKDWHPYTDPDDEDMSIWDSSLFLAAIKSGEDSALSDDEKLLLKIFNNLLDELIDENMSDYEKEWAVYHWLISNVEYDKRHYEVPSTAPRESYEPMGAIAGRKAICLGYATAFQLFMDALDIECITVVGACNGSSADHAWNMVKLDGKWYCVDPTWDATALDWSERQKASSCLYFNVTSGEMAESNHQWDYLKYPVATVKNGGK